MKHNKSKKRNKRIIPKFVLIGNLHAVNTVIANMILIAAVIVMGFVVLSYVLSNSNDYKTEYQQTVSAEIQKLKETLAYEYIYYNSTSKELSIYVMNAGTIDLQVDKVYLNTATESFAFRIFDLSGQEKTDKTIAVRQERVIIVSNLDLSSGVYTVKLMTTRGLIFANNFLC